MRTVSGFGRQVAGLASRLLRRRSTSPAGFTGTATAPVGRPLLTDSVGLQQREGVVLDQVDGTACGSAVLVALAAWADPEDNPWTRLPAVEAVRRGLTEPPPQVPGQFAWAPDGRCEDALADAGFGDVEVDDVRFTYRFSSFEEWWAVTLDMSHFFASAIAGADADTREALREGIRAAAEPFRAADGAYALPARTWVAAATA